jgi:hypothetical protein
MNNDKISVHLRLSPVKITLPMGQSIKTPENLLFSVSIPNST